MPVLLAVIVLRFVQYVGASALFGAPLFFLYNPGLAAFPWQRRLAGIAALTVAIAAPLNFLAQTAQVAGSVAALADIASLKAALLEMDFGKSCAVRTFLGVAGLLAVYRLPAGLSLWRVCAVIGAFTCASFSWMGHGAATEGTMGWLHLGNDILHTMAAAGWIGALTVFSLLLFRRAEPHALAPALRGFSAIGVGFVCVIAGTGVVNSYFMVGLKGVPLLWSSLYGQVLLAKIALFAAMLLLAARNRFTYTPALEAGLVSRQGEGAAIASLKQSVILETAFGILVLALVAWLGMLEPPSALMMGS